MINEFMGYLKEIKEEYGITFKNISTSDMKLECIAEVTRNKQLRLNVSYFNSRKLFNDALVQFKEKGILPKKADLKYIAGHEWGHYITIDELNQNKHSNIIISYKRAIKNKKTIFVALNRRKNVFEFAADSIACKIDNIPCKWSDIVLNSVLR